MERLKSCLLVILCLVQLLKADDHLAVETERLRNTPPELSAASESVSATEIDPQIQPRFIPFSASFSLNAGGNTAQTFSIAGTPDGIGLSQSASHASGGSNANGNPGFSASQSSSLAAGLNGISTSDSNAFAGNHPLYGPTSQTDSNSFSVGQASASSHGDVVNGQAISGAQSSVGATNTQASSGAQNYGLRPQLTNISPNYGSGNNGDYYHNKGRGMPTLHITVSDGKERYNPRPSNGWFEVKNPRDSWRQPEFCKNYSGWYRDPRCRKPNVAVTKPGQRPYYENVRDPRQDTRPSVSVSGAHAGSSAQAGTGGLTIIDPRPNNRPNVQVSGVHSATSAQSGIGGLAIGQSSSQSNQGNRGPHSLTINRVETNGNAQANAQGSAGSVHLHNNHNRPGNLQAGLSSASISANSRPGGSAQGISLSSSSGGNSNSQVTGSSSNGGSVHGSANSGSVVTFPGPSTQQQIIPKEFVRSRRPKNDDPIGEFITDLADTVYDVLDY